MDDEKELVEDKIQHHIEDHSSNDDDDHLIQTHFEEKFTGTGDLDESSFGQIDLRFLSSLIYIFSILGGIVGLIFEKSSRYIIFNSYQSLYTGILWAILLFMFLWTKIGFDILFAGK